HVAAVNDLTMKVYAGALAVGAAGLAGGVDVGIVRNDTTAYIGGDDVRARRDIFISALANKEIESYAVSFGVGAGGLGGSVIAYAIGGNFSGSYSFDSNNDGATSSSESENALTGSGNTSTIGFVDGQTGVGGVGSLLGPYPSTGRGNAANVDSATTTAT